MVFQHITVQYISINNTGLDNIGCLRIKCQSQSKPLGSKVNMSPETRTSPNHNYLFFGHWSKISLKSIYNQLILFRETLAITQLAEMAISFVQVNQMCINYPFKICNLRAEISSSLKGLFFLQSSFIIVLMN